MKKKIGELYDKPIVIGNPNEFTKNEIPLKSLGESFDDGMEYYLVLDSVIISGRYGTSVCSIIKDGKIYNVSQLGKDIVAFSTSNKMLIPDYGYTMKELLISYNNDLTDSSKFKRITAKEYYSLID